MRLAVPLGLMAACTSPPQLRAPATAAVALESILDAPVHHLDQDPDPDCRIDWRPRTLRVSRRLQSPQFGELRATARSFEGVRYRYGGTGDDGLDCSGFTNKIFATHGYDLPRTAAEQFKVGVEVRRKDLQPGDLLFFRERPDGGRISHVAFYLGNDRFMHASSGQKKVGYDTLNSSYYRLRYAGARRVAAMPPGIYSTYQGTAKGGLRFDATDEARAFFSENGAPCAGGPN